MTPLLGGPMLWNTKLSRASITAEYESLVHAGESPTSAFNHVNTQLDDILRDVLEEVGPAAARDVQALMEWWNCEA